MPSSESTRESPTCFSTVFASPFPQSLDLENIMVLVIEKSKLKLFRDRMPYSNSVGSQITFKAQQNVKHLSGRKKVSPAAQEKCY